MQRSRLWRVHIQVYFIDIFVYWHNHIYVYGLSKFLIALLFVSYVSLTKKFVLHSPIT